MSVHCARYGNGGFVHPLTYSSELPGGADPVLVLVFANEGMQGQILQITGLGFETWLSLSEHGAHDLCSSASFLLLPFCFSLGDQLLG